MPDRVIIREERHRDHAINLIQALNIAEPWDLTIKPYKRDRSLEQNRLYWKWVSIIADDLGYNKDEMHEELMRQYLEPVLVNTPSGIVEIYSTKKLKVKEMAAYLTNIDIGAAKMSIGLPRPKEQGLTA